MECKSCGYQFRLEEGDIIYRNCDYYLCHACVEKERLKVIIIAGSICLTITAILITIFRGIPFLITKLSP